MENFTKESIEKAIEIIDNNPELRKGRNSLEYDLVYSNQSYPPILVLSEANKIVGGEPLTLEDFNNSAQKAFKILKKHGFEIKNKASDFSAEIKKFIAQSRTPDLSTKHYPKDFEGLKVEVSFGKGNQARIPWIAFLSEGQTVQNGIYPVYLFYKEKEILILAYGLSETNKPAIFWDLKEEFKTIKDFSLKEA